MLALSLILKQNADLPVKLHIAIFKTLPYLLAITFIPISSAMSIRLIAPDVNWA
jgi:hypothetical protein